MAIVFVAAGVQDISRSIPRWHPKAVDLEMLLMMQSTAAAVNTIAIVLNMFCCYCFSNFMDLNNMRKK